MRAKLLSLLFCLCLVGCSKNIASRNTWPILPKATAPAIIMEDNTPLNEREQALANTLSKDRRTIDVYNAKAKERNDKIKAELLGK